MDSGIEYMEDRYGPAPPQPGGRKCHADDDMLKRPYIDVPDNTERMPWDALHKRMLFGNVVPTPQVEVHKSCCIRTCSG